MSTFIQFIHIFKKCINISTFFFLQNNDCRCLKQQGGFFLERVFQPLSGSARTSGTREKRLIRVQRRVKFNYKGVNFTGTPCGRQQQNYHRGRSTSIPSLQKHSFPSTGCPESRNQICFARREDAMPIVDQNVCVYLIA